MHARVKGKSFNPTLVRLRRVVFIALRNQDPQFQSHAGSIEAVGRLASYVAKYVFQSHAGSIEALG